MLCARVRRARRVDDWWPALSIVVAHAFAGIRDDAERGGTRHFQSRGASERPWLCPRLRAFARIANVARELGSLYAAEVRDAFAGSVELANLHVWWARVRSGMVYDLPYLADGLPPAVLTQPVYDQGAWAAELRGPLTSRAVEDELLCALDFPMDSRGRAVACNWERVAEDECRDYLFSQALACDAAYCAPEQLPLLRRGFADTQHPQPCTVVGLPADAPPCIVAAVLRLRAGIVLMARRGVRSSALGGGGLHRACANRRCGRVCFVQRHFGTSRRVSVPLGWNSHRRARDERCRALLPWAAFANADKSAQRYWLEAGLGCRHVGEEPAVAAAHANLGACCSSTCAAAVRRAVELHVPFAERVVDTFEAQHKPTNTPLDVLADAAFARNAAAHAALRRAPPPPADCAVSRDGLALFESRLRRALSVDAMLVHVAMLCKSAGRAPLMLLSVWQFIGAQNWRMESRYRYPLRWLAQQYDTSDASLEPPSLGARKQLLLTTRVGSSLLERIEKHLFEWQNGLF